MDALDQILEAAHDLLGRVDRALADSGAPADHRVWPLLRTVRALPGDAVAAVAALRPGALAAASGDMRPLVEAYDEAAAAVGGEQGWSGAAADACRGRVDALAGQLSGADGGLVERARSMAGFADAVAVWMHRSRRELARRLAAALGSAQAVVVRTARDAAGGMPPAEAATAAAAADIAAWVLETVATVFREGWTLREQWAPRLAEQDGWPPPGGAPPTGGPPAGGPPRGAPPAGGVVIGG